MKISLIGATGFVGNAILNELLERNYQVNAISRNADKLTIENENLQKKNIDVFNELPNEMDFNTCLEKKLIEYIDDSLIDLYMDTVCKQAFYEGSRSIKIV